MQKESNKLDLVDLNDKKAIKSLTKSIKELSKQIDQKIRIMHVCGTHENTISESGLRTLLPENIEMVAGPGCPVCVTPVEDIVRVSEIAKQKDMTITTFGDMYQVPTPYGSLEDQKSKGLNVKVIYSVKDSLEMAEENSEEIIHFAAGFETTTPPTSAVLMDAKKKDIDNFYLYSVHRLTPPAVESLLELGVEFDGLIVPGHVATITGVEGWESLLKHGIPEVVAGFEPSDVLASIKILLEQIIEGKAEIKNEYKRAVSYEGNTVSQKLMEKTFDITEGSWRSLGNFPGSAREIKDEYSKFNAKKFDVEVEVPEQDELSKKCRCGDVLRGKILPTECDLFKEVCTPKDPVGPCMVSQEGTCKAFYKYGGTNQLKQ